MEEAHLAAIGCQLASRTEMQLLAHIGLDLSAMIAAGYRGQRRAMQTKLSETHLGSQKVLGVPGL